MGSRILIIRLVSLVSVVIIVFAVAWYLFTRLTQITTLSNEAIEVEANNPRLNKASVISLEACLEERQFLYKQNLDNQTPAENPFK